jgi:predicted SAM-dependent methyltransferase
MRNIVFDEAGYLRLNPDVASAVNAGQFKSGLAHYELFGREEGRTCFGLSRHEKVMVGLKRDGLGLEIGPSYNPIAPKRQGYNVHILDYLDQKALRDKYADHSQYGVNIEDVDFVWQGQPLSDLIGKTGVYDWIIASHVIEHVPDLITFLQQCEALLKPEGRLSLVVPDKRYCFDHFNPYSSSGEFLDAYEEKRSRPSVGKVFDHFANACKRGGKIAWSSAETGPFELIHSTEQARSLWNQARSTDTYIDTHCWRFTPESFRLVLADFTRLELVGLEVVKEFSTVGCEFYVALGKTDDSLLSKELDQDRLGVLQARKNSDV